ncbi:MAG: Dodecaprenyl-phosphate galacturonate synthase [Gammaproteobacteria bacterium]|nr:Dodecaprenyl-phosphate galacturonate synthase [Gammaproteobacteria bacterium]
MNEKLSIVIPVFDEAENIERLYSEITQTLSDPGYEYEIVFVDDGSRDKGLQKLLALRESDDRVKIISFRKNFGQTAALSAGFDCAQGEIVVTMDADLQNDPADIPILLGKIEEGYDLVSGWRYDRQDKWLSRRLPSVLANKLISWATDVKLNDYGCTLKAIKREVVKNITLYGELHRFIPAIASWMGVRIAEVKVNHRPRVAGQSKYGISRAFRVLLDLVTVKFLLSYSGRPIQFFGIPGLISGLLGGALAVYLTIQRVFMGIPLGDRPILLLAVLLILIGVQFVVFGLLGELQTRTYYESLDKPIYFIKDKYGID